MDTTKTKTKSRKNIWDKKSRKEAREKVRAAKIAALNKAVAVLGKAAVKSEKELERLDAEITKVEKYLEKLRNKRDSLDAKSKSLFRRFNSAEDKLAAKTALKLPKGM